MNNSTALAEIRSCNSSVSTDDDGFFTEHCPKEQRHSFMQALIYRAKRLLVTLGFYSFAYEEEAIVSYQ